MGGGGYTVAGAEKTGPWLTHHHHHYHPSFPFPNRRMWRFLSISAGSDVSLGMADRIAGSLGITRLDLEDRELLARTPLPATERCVRMLVGWLVGRLRLVGGLV